MYQDEKAYQEIPEKPREQPVLQKIQDKFIKQNVEYSDALHEIEGKLHSIFNVRTPETITDKKQETPINNDFYAGISQQLDIMQTGNFRLKKVLEHLQRIV